MRQKTERITTRLYVTFVECKWRIIHKKGSIIGELPILITETIAIWEILKHPLTEKYSRFIIESDYLTAILSINGKSISPIVIFNLVENIKNLASNIDRLNFVYYIKRYLMSVFLIFVINNSYL